MRKLILGLTAGTLSLLSCTQKEVSELALNNKVLHFSTYVGKQTRAAEFNNSSWVDGNRFTIKAYLNNSGWKTYFTDQLLFDGTTKEWSLLGPDRFQVPYETKYIATFPDQASYTDADINFTNQFPSFVYTVDGNTDLIGVMSDHQQLDTQIKLPFRHLLSQINFGIYDYPGAKITISNIRLSGIKTIGTFIFKPVDTESYKFIGSWTLGTDDSDLQSFTYTFGQGNTFTTAGQSASTSYVFGDGGNYAADNDNNSVKYVYPDGKAYAKDAADKPEEALSNSLMLLPQGITDFTTNDAKLTFTYTVTDLTGFVIGQNENRTGVVALNDLQMAWKSNYRYIYMLKFNFDEDKFGFHTEVISWENEGSGNSNTAAQ